MKSNVKIYRILDANFNRAREGFRVCEEITRFILDDKQLTQKLKACRHRISDLLKKLPEEAREHLLASRSVSTDVGQEYSPLEGARSNTEALFAANIQRCKESLRVLEETAKILDSKIPVTIKKIRFETYEIEKRAMPRLVAVRDNRRQKKNA